MTITARFVDNNSLSSALLALAGDDIHTDRASLRHSDAQEARHSPSDLCAAIGGALGMVAAGTAGVATLIVAGGALIAAETVVVAASSAAAGGMAGGLVGAFMGGETATAKSRSDEDEHSPVVLTVDIRDDQALQARRVLHGAGATMITSHAADESPGELQDARHGDLKGSA